VLDFNNPACYNKSAEGRGHFYLPVKLPLFVECPRPSARLRQTTDGGILIRGSMLKQCTKCKGWKPADQFGKRSASPDGLRPICKPCKYQQNLDWLQKNFDKFREIDRAWKRSHRDQCRETERRYRAENREKDRAMSRNRNARERGSNGKITAAEWETLKAKFGYTCLCCKRSEPEIKLTLDHVLPLAKGGKNVIENAQPLCGSCNYSKGAKHIDYRGAK
jgi:5-methylcytosine-specific restriction endonuclease McrA